MLNAGFDPRKTTRIVKAIKTTAVRRSEEKGFVGCQVAREYMEKKKISQPGDVGKVDMGDNECRARVTTDSTTKRSEMA